MMEDGQMKIISEFIKDKNRQRIGALVAAKVNGKVVIGVSKLRKGDTFDKKIGMQIALNRLLKYVENYGEFSYIEVPSLRPYLELFKKRCERYFKTANISTIFDEPCFD